MLTSAFEVERICQLREAAISAFLIRMLARDVGRGPTRRKDVTDGGAGGRGRARSQTGIEGGTQRGVSACFLRAFAARTRGPFICIWAI